MKNGFTILIVFCSLFQLRSQTIEDILNSKRALEINMNDERLKGVQDESVDWKYAREGRSPGVVYIDKLLWSYQPSSEHPYTAIAYRMQFFRQTDRGMINYQIINENDKDFDKAYYYWEGDSIARVVMYNSVTKAIGGATLEVSKMGGVPEDIKEN
jgi:hypothetical protein